MTHKGRVFLPKECCLSVTVQSLTTLRKASAVSVAACTFLPHGSWRGDSTPFLRRWDTGHPTLGALPTLHRLSLCLQDGNFPRGGRGGPEGVPGPVAAQPPSHRKHPHAPACGHQHVCSIQLSAQRYHVLIPGNWAGDQPLFGRQGCSCGEGGRDSLAEEGWGRGGAVVGCLGMLAGVGSAKGPG